MNKAYPETCRGAFVMILSAPEAKMGIAFTLGGIFFTELKEA